MIHVHKVFRFSYCDYFSHRLILSCFLLQSVAHVEAVIDFGEDENIEEGLLPEGKWILGCYAISRSLQCDL